MIYNKSTNAPVHWLTLHGRSPSIIHPFTIDNEWICSAIDLKQRLCWIPVSYRPTNGNFLVMNRTHIALGSKDGHVVVLDVLGKPFLE